MITLKGIIEYEDVWFNSPASQLAREADGIWRDYLTAKGQPALVATRTKNFNKRKMPKSFLLKRYIKPEVETEEDLWPASGKLNGSLVSSWVNGGVPENKKNLLYFLNSPDLGATNVHGESSFLNKKYEETSGADKKWPVEGDRSPMTPEAQASLDSKHGGLVSQGKPHKKSPSGAALPTKPPYKCEQCDKIFKTKYTLTIHLKMPSHTGARPFVCGVCGKGFRLSSTLCRHKIIHTSDKPHKCSICHKAFNRSSTLKTHVRTHSEAKEFRCNLCGKGFHQKGNLRNHVLIHTGEKPYRCSLCEKAFNKLSNLKFHLHVHTDNAPYRCRYCKVHFSRRCDLKEHISASHKNI